MDKYGKKTVKVSLNLWKELQKIRIEKNISTMEEVIDLLLDTYEQDNEE